MKMFLVLSFVFFSAGAFACRTDYDCGYGNKCIKPAGSYSLTGSCVTPTNEYGQRDYNSYKGWGNNSQPREVSSCQFNTDCTFGFKCMKEAGQMYGLCTK